MKKLRKILSLFLFLGVVLIFSNTKSFAAGIQYTENLIPKMTSNTTPNGIASASDTYIDAYDSGNPWKAFDGIVTIQDYGPYNSWVTANTSGWLAYEFTSPHAISKYTIQKKYLNSDSVGNFPQNWTFEAWDGVNWVVLDTQSNITDWANGIKKEFVFVNDTFYNKYRINVTSNLGGTQLIIGELEMMEKTNSTTTPEITLKTVLEVNEKLQLSINDNLALNTDMTWSSSDSTVATVDASGIVKGVKAGNAVVTVTNQDGTYSDTIKILVIESETEVAIDLKVGETRRLTIDDLAGTTSATWSSDSQTIATVSNIGKVTAVSAGTTYVIVKDDQGNEIGKICVRVRN